MDELGGKIAELLGQAAKPAHLREVAGLPQRRPRTAAAAPGEPAMGAVLLALITVAMASASPNGRTARMIAGASIPCRRSVEVGRQIGMEDVLEHPPNMRQTHPIMRQVRGDLVGAEEPHAGGFHARRRRPADDLANENIL